MIKAMVSIVKCEVETSPRVLVLRGAQLLKKKKKNKNWEKEEDSVVGWRLASGSCVGLSGGHCPSLKTAPPPLLGSWGRHWERLRQ